MNVRDLRASQWYWVDNRVLDIYAKQTGVIPYAVYQALCRHANAESKCWPSAKTIAEKLGIGERTFFRSINILVEHKLISVESGTDNGVANTYTLLDIPYAPQADGYVTEAQGGMPQRHTNNTNITIPINKSVLQTKTPSKVLKEKVAKSPLAVKESSGHQEVIAYFVNAYQVKTGNKYHFLPKDAATIANLLKSVDKTEIMKRIDVLFTSKEPFYKLSGYTTGVLSACFNKLNPVSNQVSSGASGREL